MRAPLRLGEQLEKALAEGAPPERIKELMSKLREELIKNNETINWYPNHIKEGRFGEWLREVKDWAKLTRFLREWVKGGKTKSGPIYRDRVMLTNYMLVLTNTGIRVGEARSLKWSDIDTFVGDDGKENIVLQVRGKTGAREVVARTLAVKDYLQRIWELRCDELKAKPSMSEAIFCHKDGKPIHSFKKGFNALIKEAGVEFDTNGQRRVIYSLRHTYATFRLHEGVNHFTLARNMGTSVKMLESFYGHTSNRAMASELTKTRSKARKRLPWEGEQGSR